MRHANLLNTGASALALAVLLACALNEGPGGLGGCLLGLFQVALGACFIPLGDGSLGLLTQVMCLALAEVALTAGVQQGRYGGGLRPIPTTTLPARFAAISQRSRRTT